MTPTRAHTLTYPTASTLAAEVAGELRRLAVVHRDAANELAATAGYWRTDDVASEHFAAARALTADAEALERGPTGPPECRLDQISERPAWAAGER